MGKPYLYTQKFKQLGTYDYRFWGKLKTNLLSYHEYSGNNPIVETEFAHMEWIFPQNSKPRKDLYNIIIIIAKLTGTKIMWKSGLNDKYPEAETYQFFLIIGEKTRIIICNHILNYTIEGIFRFEDYLRRNERNRAKALGYKTITSYLNLKVSQRIYHIIDIMDWHIEEDQIKMRRLENYIMGRYKLYYKRYGQITNTYSNVISKYFYPKRMML